MKELGKLLLMFLLIADISSCEKQSTEPSLVGTVWSSDTPSITVHFLSATDCHIGWGIGTYPPKYTYTYQHPDIVLILNDEKTSAEYYEDGDDSRYDKPLLFIFPKEYRGTINDGSLTYNSYMILKDVKSGSIIPLQRTLNLNYY